MSSAKSYTHPSAEHEEPKEVDDLLPSSTTPSPEQPPALTLPKEKDAPAGNGGSKYAPKLRSAVRNLQAVKRTASASHGYDWGRSGGGAEVSELITCGKLEHVWMLTVPPRLTTCLAWSGPAQRCVDPASRESDELSPAFDLNQTHLVLRFSFLRTANFDHLAAPLNVSISQYDQFQVQKEEVSPSILLPCQMTSRAVARG